MNLFERIDKLERQQSLLTQRTILPRYNEGYILFGKPSGAIGGSANLQWVDGLAKIVQGGGNNQSLVPIFLDAKGTDSSDATTQEHGAIFQQSFTPGAVQITTGKFAGVFRATLSGTGGTNASGAIQALRNEVVTTITGGTFSGVAYGIDAILRHSGSQALANVRLMRAIPVLTGTGNVTDYRGLFADSPIVTSSGVITTAYGVYIARQKIASGVTTGYGVYQENVNDLNYFGGPIDLPEITAPSAPAANMCRLFVRDNGAGKTQFCAIFNTGAIQVIATQP